MRLCSWLVVWIETSPLTKLNRLLLHNCCGRCASEIRFRCCFNGLLLFLPLFHPLFGLVLRNQLRVLEWLYRHSPSFLYGHGCIAPLR